MEPLSLNGRIKLVVATCSQGVLLGWSAALRIPVYLAFLRHPQHVPTIVDRELRLFVRYSTIVRTVHWIRLPPAYWSPLASAVHTNTTNPQQNFHLSCPSPQNIPQTAPLQPHLII